MAKHPEIIKNEEISHERFIDSWRGTFASKDFGEKEQRRAVELLKTLK